jgi:hypothetical protein
MKDHLGLGLATAIERVMIPVSESEAFPPKEPGQPPAKEPAEAPEAGDNLESP